MRTIYNIAIIFSLLFLPWWLTCLILVAAFSLVPRFFEGIFYGILLDALYGTRLGIHGFAYVFTLGAVIIFFLASTIRQKIVW